jgi:hypothetical protein
MQSQCKVLALCQNYLSGGIFKSIQKTSMNLFNIAATPTVTGSVHYQTRLELGKVDEKLQ